MTTATINPPAPATLSPTPWRRLLRVAAAATIVVSVAQQLLNRFFGISLVVLAVLLAVGLLLDVSRRRAGALLLAATSVLFLILHVAVLVMTLHYVDIAEAFVPVAGLVMGLSLVLIAAIPTVRSQTASTPSTRTPTLIAVVTVAAWALVGTYSVVQRVNIADVQARPGDIVIDVSDGPHSAPNLNLPSGETSVVFHNLDDSPLLLESAAGHLRLGIPANFSRRIHLVLEAGIYRYTIDGPDQRITGTLTVG